MGSKAFEKILVGLNQARAYARGEHVPGLRVHKVKVKRNEIAAVRLREGLTQAQFAELLGTSLGTVRKWESGERKPSGAAARLIQLMVAKPKIVTKTLGIKVSAAKRHAKSGLIAAE
jgi:putative transcriptional regulator